MRDSALEAAAPEYYSRSYGHVVIFDFFLPLSKEASLRAGLDGLFYRDVVEQRLARLSAATLARVFGEEEGESPEARIARACEWVSARFRGYSITHVSGRFRAGALKTAAEAAGEDPTGVSYIADETTAMVRFVFPVGSPVENRYLPDEESILRLLEHGDDEAARAEADRLRGMFYTLFVDPVVRGTGGEEEIWLLESGYVNRLHKWVRK